jgi:hypothetical protein
MKTQVYNPYLPSYEYVPDGEPHIFGDRVYVYGSHDRFNAPIFCMNDYVCYSAPLDDLSDWKYEGVIFRKNQDPMNRLGIRLLFAPDVVQGKDGRFYLYYAFDFVGVIGVAVSDAPAGPYEFYGHVHDKQGVKFGRRKGDQMPFDPGVLVDDDGSVYLYSGFYTPVPAIASGGVALKNDGGVVIELAPDMVTMTKEPKLLFPKEGAGSFTNHEFFEASSIRKDGDNYIFVYSSRHNHELCYAISKYPDRDFTFGGTLVSLGDLFLNGNEDETKATNYLGNTHGGMAKIKGQWYIFYHRQTNRHSYSRQACAEKLVQRSDGSFAQAEVTSCGLNPGPLKDTGYYEARIACNLWSKEGVGRYDCPSPKKAFREHPYFTQTGKDRESDGDQYIANMRDGATAGFKYFLFETAGEIEVQVAGKASGVMVVSHDPEGKQIVAEVPIQCNSGHETQVAFATRASFEKGVWPLYFTYVGEGTIDFIGFTLND